MICIGQKKELINVWGKFITELGDANGGWDWYSTLTFDDRKLHVGNGLTVRNYCNHQFFRWLGNFENNFKINRTWRNSDIIWFRAEEYSHYRDIPHFHCLIGHTGTCKRKIEWSHWFHDNGAARILPYDQRKGAGYYLAKYISKDTVDLMNRLEFSHNLKPINLSLNY